MSGIELQGDKTKAKSRKMKKSFFLNLIQKSIEIDGNRVYCAQQRKEN